MVSNFSVLSFGGGQDSAALLHLYLNDRNFRSTYAPGHFISVMSATGDEHPHTNAYVQEVSHLCGKHGLEFYHLTPDLGFHVPSWPDLITPQLREVDEAYQPTLVQLGTKTCTLQLKLGPIYKFLDAYINKRLNYGFTVQPSGGCQKQAIRRFGEEHGMIRMLIGFAAGEERRMENSLKQEAQHHEGTSFWRHIKRYFPLIDLGMDRAACQRFLYEASGYVPYPSNCMRCPYMSMEELLWLELHYPEKLAEWAFIEERKLRRFEGTEKNHGVFNTKKTIKERLTEVRAKYEHLPRPELLKHLDNWKMNHGCGSGGY